MTNETKERLACYLISFFFSSGGGRTNTTRPYSSSRRCLPVSAYISAYILLYIIDERHGDTSVVLSGSYSYVAVIPTWIDSRSFRCFRHDISMYLFLGFIDIIWYVKNDERERNWIFLGTKKCTMFKKIFNLRIRIRYENWCSWCVESVSATLRLHRTLDGNPYWFFETHFVYLSRFLSSSPPCPITY